jgi:pimeloyl-ACP methyl ester carboxylesterase
MPPRLIRLSFALMGAALLAVPLAPAQAAPSAQAQAAPAQPVKRAPVARSGQTQREPQVYLFRGLANVFSRGMDDMSKQLTARGVPNRVLNHANWPRIAADITAKYKANPKQTRPIVLVGHSLGANAVLLMSQQLVRNGVPVDLVVTFDPTTSGPVVPGVRRYLNLYQSNNGWSSALAVPPGTGKRVTNSDVRKRDDIKTISHFDIEKNQTLHAEVLADIVRLTGARGKAPANRAR